MEAPTESTLVRVEPSGAEPVPATPNIAGYDIVWRETTAPFWQGAQFVGNVTRATVPLSKDDYLFSVRAVDSAGHRSLGSYPLSLRRPAVVQPK